MATLEQVIELTTKLGELSAKIDAITIPVVVPDVDLQPVIDATAALTISVDSLVAKLNPTA